MSRAFVRESDQESAAELWPELLISRHPNLVTAEGLRKIEAQVTTLEAQRQSARTDEDKAALARVARDLRYWTQRLATARVTEPADVADAAGFGMCVTLRFDDGEERAFRLVGEDEADPAAGLVSWVSPLAQALLGRAPGETVDILGRRAEIVSLRSKK